MPELDPGDEATATEIHLVMSNDADLYRQMAQPWAKNFARKMKRGVFSESLARGAISKYLAAEAVRRYQTHEAGGQIGKVPKAVRDRIGELWYPAIVEEAEYYVEHPAELKARRMQQ